MVEKIGDPELQSLFEDHNISWDVVKGRGDLPRIEVTFPIPEDLSNYDLECPGCGKLARATLGTDSTPFPSRGVSLNFRNVIICKVDGCGMESIEEDVFKRFFDEYMKGVESEQSKMFEACIDGHKVDFQSAIISKMYNFVVRRFNEKGIQLQPPPLDKIKEALDLT